MKKYLVALLSFLLFSACTPENIDNSDDQNCPDGAVDLGIVMTREDGSTYKLYWAKSNLCESGLCANPEDDGDYYAWGETEPKTDYTWSTYKWCDGDEIHPFLTKYNTDSSCGVVDNNFVLDPEDDAAHVKLGGKWRMPTDEEWTELRTKCKWKWTTKGKRKGYKVTSKTNGNSIFLPAAGRYGTRLLYVGENGFYWASSLGLYYYDDSEPKWQTIRYEFYLHTDDVFRRAWSGCDGHSIRPVSE